MPCDQSHMSLTYLAPLARTRVLARGLYSSEKIT
jgi:hypothetical protein